MDYVGRSTASRLPGAHSDRDGARQVATVKELLQREYDYAAPLPTPPLTLAGASRHPSPQQDLEFYEDNYATSRVQSFILTPKVPTHGWHLSWHHSRQHSWQHSCNTHTHQSTTPRPGVRAPHTPRRMLTLTAALSCSEPRAVSCVRLVWTILPFMGDTDAPCHATH